MSNNSNLHKAKATKADEFYTQLGDIENEMKHYKKHFQDKIILCNCDDPYESNFFKYFAANFKSLKLKKLIATSYVDSLVQGQQISFLDMKELTNQTDNKRPYKVEITQIPAKDTDGTIKIRTARTVVIFFILRWILINPGSGYTKPATRKALRPL